MKSILLYRQNFSVFSVSFLLFSGSWSFCTVFFMNFERFFFLMGMILKFCCTVTAWKMTKHGVFSGPYFTVFWLTNSGKYVKHSVFFTQWVRYFNEIKQIFAKNHNVTPVILKLLERKLHEGLAEHDIVVNYFCFSFFKMLIRIHTPYMYLYV